MGLTAINKLPYPEPTDSVDVPRDVKALADAVDPLTLPVGYARARCTTAASHGAGTWNTAQLDVLTDARGAQPWALEAASRRVKITKAGVYALQASLTMGNVFAIAVAISADGTNWDRVAATPIGTTSYTNAVTAIRYLAANTYVAMQMYQPAAQSTVADTTNSPSYLAVQALGQ